MMGLVEKWRTRRREKELERRRNESWDETLERIRNADYVIKTGGGSLFSEDGLKGIDPEALRKYFLDRFDIDIVNPNGGPDWGP